MLLTFLATVCLACFGGGGACCGGVTGGGAELRPLFLVCRTGGVEGAGAAFFNWGGAGGGNWAPVAGAMVPTIRPILGSITNW